MKLDKHDKKLLKITKKSYKKIAKDFSVSRSYVWSDLQPLLNYINDYDRVLDLGCGNGRLIDVLDAKKVSYVGADNSKNLLRQARRKFPEYYFELQDMLDLNFIKRSFDAVIATAVLNHLPSAKVQLAVLKNLREFILPGGLLMMSNWNLYNKKNKKGVEVFEQDKKELSASEFKKKYKIAKSKLNEKDVMTIWDNDNLLYYYAFDAEELEKLLTQAGFDIIENYYSKNGQKASKEDGHNIITIAKSNLK